ncbi:ADP-ribosylation factor GTPase-activating protein, putative, partial [Bodo saltans]
NAESGEAAPWDLRKLVNTEGNKHCAICATRGPIYAVLDFHIFVCSTCSAIHRSMQHKVKGLSMSEFTDEELAALRVGGNVRAASIWKAGYHLSPPPAGDDYRVRECIRACFEERRFFDRAAFNALQEEIATAILPPVKVLTSLDAIPAPQPSSSLRPAQPTPAATSSSAATTQQPPKTDAPKHQQAPPATVPVQVQSSAHESTDLLPRRRYHHRKLHNPQHQRSLEMPLTISSRLGQRRRRLPRHQHQHLSGQVMDDPFGPMSSATTVPPPPRPAAQQQEPNAMDFFTTSSPAPPAPAHHTAQHYHGAPSTTDFFSAPQTSSSVAAPRDFFASAPEAGPRDFFSAPLNNNAAGNDFFAVPSAAKADVFAPTVWEKRPTDANLSQHNNMWGPPQSSAPPPQIASNAFADLDPFGARPRV